jgi:hypothetical protein
LFNTYTPSKALSIRGETRETAAGDTVAKGVFVTPQTITTFPVATFAVTIVWRVAAALFPSAKTSLWVPLATSLVVGSAIYLIAYTDPKAASTQRDKLIGAFVCLLNSLYLFASATGLAKALAP